MKTLRHPLALALALAALVTTARAQTVSPVPAPTIITTAPYTISKPGFYQLGNDLVVNNTTGNIITIAASNVTLDFAGHYISGPSSASAVASGGLVGVYSEEEGNLTIRNGTVAYCFEGVVCSGNGSGTSLNINQHIDNMLVSYCSYVGIYAEIANNSAVTNCRVSFTGGNTSLGGAYGIAYYAGTGNTAAGCTVTNTTGTDNNAYGIYNSGTLTAQNNTITGVTSSSYSAYGIYDATFAVGNTVSSAQTGFNDCVKYANNLTSGCKTPFSGGTAEGYNN